MNAIPKECKKLFKDLWILLNVSPIAKGRGEVSLPDSIYILGNG